MTIKCQKPHPFNFKDLVPKNFIFFFSIPPMKTSPKKLYFDNTEDIMVELHGVPDNVHGKSVQHLMGSNLDKLNYVMQ